MTFLHYKFICMTSTPHKTRAFFVFLSSCFTSSFVTSYKVKCSKKAMDIIGYGFRPSEEELVDYYLKHRLLADDPRVHVIPDINLCKVEPWKVPSNGLTLHASSCNHFFFIFTSFLFVFSFLVWNSAISGFRCEIRSPRMVFLQSCGFQVFK